MLLISKDELFERFVSHAYKVTYDRTSTEYGMTLTGIRQVIDEIDEGSLRQIFWERDMAISQLHDLGYGFGEKIRKGDMISRQAVHYTIKNLLCDVPFGDYETGFNDALLTFDSLLKNLPSIGCEVNDDVGD